METTQLEPQMKRIFQEALRRGYRYDKVSGVIYGLRGRPLKMTKTGSQRYPTVSFSVPGIGVKNTYSPTAHRFAGYCIWGDQIFLPDVCVRHQNGLWDIRACSLKIGTGTENMADIPPEVRSRAAAAGRASQPKQPASAKLLDDTVRFLRRTVRRDKGFLVKGELDRLRGLTGVRKDVISAILRGVIYTTVK